MEPFIVLVSLFLIGLLLLAAVFAVLAYSRTGDLMLRVSRLEKQLASARKVEETVTVVAAAPVMTPAPSAASAPVPRPAPIPQPASIPAAAPTAAHSTTSTLSPVFVSKPAPVAAPRIEWERWLGVRGAAVLGGIFLAVAGILFFQYSIEHGLITPLMRVIGGTIFGSACLVGGEWARRKQYDLTANAISGAGAVILYAAFWAANLFGIVPLLVAFAAMCAVTALACWLSWRNGSQLIAWLGLTGGFATPILLSSGQDHPIGLLAYLLLLDVGFLLVANRRGWSMLGLLGLAGTFVIWGMWIADRMGPETFLVALSGLGLFALLFALLVPKKLSAAKSLSIASSAGALLLPFAFAMYFAQRIDVGYHVFPLVILGVLLGCASCWMARKENAPWLLAGAAAGATSTLLVWSSARTVDVPRAWELTICIGALAGAFLGFCEWRRPTSIELRRGHDVALLVVTLGALMALFAAMSQNVSLEPWAFTAGFAVLACVIARSSALSGWSWVAQIGFFVTAAGVTGAIGWREDVARELEPWLILAAIFGLVATFHVSALLRRDEAQRRKFFLATVLGTLPLFLLPMTDVVVIASDNTEFCTCELLLGLTAACAATGARSGIALGVAMLCPLLALTAQPPYFDAGAPECLAAAVAGFVLFLAWPLYRPRAWVSAAGGWYASAIAGGLWFHLGEEQFVRRFGDANVGLFCAGATVIVLGVAWAALRPCRAELAPERADDRSTRARGGLAYLALAGFIASAILSHQLGLVRDEVAWATTALAFAWLWRTSAPRGYRLLAALSATVAVVPALFVALNDVLDRKSTPLWNMHAFNYLLPGVALLIGAWSLRCSDPARLSSEERQLDLGRFGGFASQVGLCGLAYVFLWINVELQNGFATGKRFELRFSGDLAHPTWTSIAWAVYALVLLGVGMWKKIGGLRWVSLVLLLVTIGKLFLLDLEDLEGLWRVASFLGLAVSLLLVSLLYQRFVFRKNPLSAPDVATAS